MEPSPRTAISSYRPKVRSGGTAASTACRRSRASPSKLRKRMPVLAGASRPARTTDPTAFASPSPLPPGRVKDRSRMVPGASDAFVSRSMPPTLRSRATARMGSAGPAPSPRGMARTSSRVRTRRGTTKSSPRRAFQSGGSTGPVSTRLAPARTSSSSGRPACRDTTTIEERRVPAFSRSRTSNPMAAGASVPSTTTMLGTKARATSRAPPGVDTSARSTPSAQRIVRSRSVPSSAEPTIRTLGIGTHQPP